MEIDLERWQNSLPYIKSYYQVLSGESVKQLQEYPDDTDESVLQYVFDTLDGDKLFNEYLYEATQSILDLWLIEDLSSAQARKQLLDLYADHCNGC